MITILLVALVSLGLVHVGYAYGMWRNIETGKFGKELDALLLLREKLVLERTHEALLYAAYKRQHTLNIGEINEVMKALDDEHPLPVYDHSTNMV